MLLIEKNNLSVMILMRSKNIRYLLRRKMISKLSYQILWPWLFKTNNAVS